MRVWIWASGGTLPHRARLVRWNTTKGDALRRELSPFRRAPKSESKSEVTPVASESQAEFATSVSDPT
jgi:hypothetical protein